MADTRFSVISIAKLETAENETNMRTKAGKYSKKILKHWKTLSLNILISIKKIDYKV